MLYVLCYDMYVIIINPSFFQNRFMKFYFMIFFILLGWGGRLFWVVKKHVILCYKSCYM
jgi:hypothetical protein